MNVQCRWCGAALPPAPTKRIRLDSPAGRGVCPQCAAALLEHLSLPFDRFLAESGPPVIIVTSDVRIVDANLAAAEMLSEDGPGHAEGAALFGRHAGEVLGCHNAGPPESCGESPRCDGCVVRQTVAATWKTGSPQMRVPATLRVTSHERRRRVSFLVTTAKVGDNVLVRIDSPKANGPEKGPA